MAEQENIALGVPQENALPEFTTVSDIPVAMLPPESSVETFSQLLPKPVAFRRKATLTTAQGFIDYVTRYNQDDGATAVFFDDEAFKFHAFFDDPSFAEVGWGDDACSYTMQKHRILNSWMPFINKQAEQRDWIDFLDERADDFISPSPAEMISLVRNFRASKSADFKHVEHADNGDVDLGYSTQTVPDASITVPTDIKISIPLWRGGERVELTGRFRYKVANGNLYIGIHLKSLADLLEADALKVVQSVTEKTSQTVIMGRSGTVESVA